MEHLPSQEAIRQIYTRVLDDALEFARTNTANENADAAEQIRRELEARIPKPSDLANEAANPELRNELRRRAAFELLEVCQQFSLPRGEFVAEVAKKASEGCQ